MTKHPTMLERRKALLALAGTLSLFAGSARAQAFPTQPVRIVPFGAAGGPIDAIARVYADKLRDRWGQPVIVESKPGASGIIAADYVAKSKPDGYTVMFTLPLSHMNVPILQKVPYNPLNDFTPLSMLATGGPMLVARADAPYKNVKEFVEYAKRQKAMTYGTWGKGSSAHLFGELLQRQSGASLIHAPYKGEAGAHNDLFGGVLDFAWANPSTARAMSQAGKMKILAISGTRRISTMPDVSTFKEQGFQGFDIDSWIGVYGPAKLPAAISKRWVDALRDITAMPDVAARLTGYGFEPLGNTPTEFLQRYRADYPRVEALIKAAGVTAE